MSSREIRAGKAYVELGAKDAKFNAAMAAAQKKLIKLGAVGKVALSGVGTGLTTGLNALSTTLTTMSAGLARVATVTAGASAAFGYLGYRQLQTIDGMAKMAKRTGLAVEAISELKESLIESDSSLEDLQVGLKTLSKNLDKATGPSEKITAALGDLGVNVEALTASSQLDRLYMLADAFQRVGRGGKAVAAAQALFGGAGTKLIPWLQGGSAGLQSARAASASRGLTVTSDAGKTIERFNDSVSALVSVFESVKIKIANDLAPQIAQLASKFEEIVAKWDALSNTSKTAIAGSVAAGAAALPGLAVGAYAGSKAAGAAGSIASLAARIAPSVVVPLISVASTAALKVGKAAVSIFKAGSSAVATGVKAGIATSSRYGKVLGALEQRRNMAARGLAARKSAFMEAERALFNPTREELAARVGSTEGSGLVKSFQQTKAKYVKGLLTSTKITEAISSQQKVAKFAKYVNGITAAIGKMAPALAWAAASFTALYTTITYGLEATKSLVVGVGAAIKSVAANTFDKFVSNIGTIVEEFQFINGLMAAAEGGGVAGVVDYLVRGAILFADLFAAAIVDTWHTFIDQASSAISTLGDLLKLEFKGFIDELETNILDTFSFGLTSLGDEAGARQAARDDARYKLLAEAFGYGKSPALKQLLSTGALGGGGLSFENLVAGKMAEFMLTNQTRLKDIKEAQHAEWADRPVVGHGDLATSFVHQNDLDKLKQMKYSIDSMAMGSYSGALLSRMAGVDKTDRNFRMVGNKIDTTNALLERLTREKEQAAQQGMRFAS